MNDIKNILIVRTDRIGDLVLTMPLAGIIKKHFPKTRVSFLVSEYTSPLLFNYPEIDELIILKEHDHKILAKENVKLLKSKNFDAALIVNASFELAAILYKSKIRNRIGTGYRWYSFLFNHKVFVHRKSGNKHELEYNVDILKYIGINENITVNNVCFNIQIDNNSKQKINKYLTPNNIKHDKIRVILHPGSGGSAFDLPKDKLKNLAELLAHELNIELIITGSKNENNLCRFVAGTSNALDLSGKLNLNEMIALIDSVDILVANSTGPIHIAAALSKYVVGFYPTINSMSQKRWGPYTSKRRVFEPENCEESNVKNYKQNNCMNKINTNNVLNSIKNIITEINSN